MTGSRRAAPALAAAVVALAVGAGCGLPAEDSARFEAGTDVPYDLLQAPGSSLPQAPSGGPGPTVELCFVDDGALVLATRSVEAGVSPGEVLALLAEGPTEDEHDMGLSTAVAEGALAEEVDSAGGIATVDLDPSFADTAGQRQLLAVAQVVCTLTGRPGLGQVAFTLDGEPVEVPRGDGSTTSAPVARDDYAEVGAG